MQPALRRLRNAIPGLTPLSRTRAAQAVLRPFIRCAAFEGGIRMQALDWWGSSGRVETYRVRGTEVRIVLRHGTRDIDIADEIFVGIPGYQVPSQAEAWIDSLRPARVLDAGANIGLFGAYVLGRFPSASIDSFEPDPTNFPLLERCRVVNRSPRTWRIHPDCLGVKDGTVHLAAGLFSDSFVTGPIEGTVAVWCRDIFPLLGKCDLAKIDIEGSEWPILADPRLASTSCRVLAIEWHDRGAPEGVEPGAHAVHLLERAGFEIVADERPQHVVWAARLPSRA